MARRGDCSTNSGTVANRTIFLPSTAAPPSAEISNTSDRSSVLDGRTPAIAVSCPHIAFAADPPNVFPVLQQHQAAHLIFVLQQQQSVPSVVAAAAAKRQNTLLSPSTLTLAPHSSQPSLLLFPVPLALLPVSLFFFLFFLKNAAVVGSRPPLVLLRRLMWLLGCWAEQIPAPLRPALVQATANVMKVSRAHVVKCPSRQRLRRISHANGHEVQSRQRYGGLEVLSK